MVFGVFLYVINFHGMTYLFPWFSDARGSATFINHVLFGLVAGDMYLALEGGGSDVNGATGAG
jgi:hypothetical protein